MDAQETEIDQNTLIKKLLEAINGSGELQSNIPENVAQLLTAALSQVVQSPQDGDHHIVSVQEDSQYLTPADNVERTVEVSGYSITDFQRPLGVKFPAEVRRRIVSMRKEGLKCKDIAKDLGASVSGVQKVWERFLATGTIRDRKPSSYAGRPKKYNNDVIRSEEENVVPMPSLCVNDNSFDETVTPQAVLVDTREPMEVPGATVEIVASSNNQQLKESMYSVPVKKKSKPYRQELCMRLIENCPLASMKNDVTMETSDHVRNLSDSINKPLYMEYVLGHPFGKAPSPTPFEADYEESKIILSDPTNPLGKEVLAALGYSTKVYFNACCKLSPLFIETHQGLPYSVGPNYIAENMRQILQLLINMCTDTRLGLGLIHKGPGPVLEARTETGDVIVTTFTPPSKLSDYWNQLYAYAKLFRCCENFLSPGPPSCPCLLCHPFESFAGSLDIADYSPPNSPYQFNTPNVLLDTATQLLQLRPTETTPTIISPEEIIVSQEDIPKCNDADICITDSNIEVQSTVHTQDIPSHTQDTVVHTQDTLVHTQDTLVHTQDTLVHTQDTLVHTQDTPAHTQDTPSHTQDTPSHTQDTPSHIQDTPSHTQDTDGIQYVAYTYNSSNPLDDGHGMIRRSNRKRQNNNDIVQIIKQTKK